MSMSIGGARVVFTEFRRSGVEVEAFNDRLEMVLALIDNGAIGGGIGYGCEEHIKALAAIEGSNRMSSCNQRSEKTTLSREEIEIAREDVCAEMHESCHGRINARGMKDISYPRCYALVSGGKDSLSAAQCLHDHGKLAGCVSFNTGVSTPDWQPFVEKTCAERGWPLEIYKTPESYDDLVLEYGFPGPGKHKKFMDRLKGRCVRIFKKHHPGGVLASGTRSGESKRREISTSPVGMWENVPIIAPIYDWSTDETWAFFHERGFERAPGYSTLQVSGDCLCGAFAREGEREALEFHYPTIGERFRNLTAQLRSRFPARCEWGWGWKQPVKKDAQVSALCVECGDADLFPETLEEAA